MRKFLDSVKTLAKDEAGVVSFEYILVAACVIIGVGFAFGTDTSGNLATSLSTAVSSVIAKLPS
ncbi:hypothetical protein [Bradyrhizobium sp. OAE829]|uniref:Flp family type IVb pilin n=1 Tax=Bradyrhizobium sp. OAE829 TaxID=2663807 RepID=UPI00178A69E4